MPWSDIELDEFCKTAIESAMLKGEWFRNSQIDQVLADFLKQYDWVLALWPDVRHPSGMAMIAIRDSGKKDGYLRVNSIPVADWETALKLHALCRGPDNQAPEPPIGPAAGNA